MLIEIRTKEKAKLMSVSNSENLNECNLLRFALITVTSRST